MSGGSCTGGGNHSDGLLMRGTVAAAAYCSGMGPLRQLYLHQLADSPICEAITVFDADIDDAPIGRLVPGSACISRRSRHYKRLPGRLCILPYSTAHTGEQYNIKCYARRKQHVDGLRVTCSIMTRGDNVEVRCSR